MATTTQTQRIKLILDLLLSENLQTIKTIQEQLFNNEILISDRQIYRDLEDLEKSFLRKGETLIIKTEGNKKFWQVINDPNAQRINDFDLKTFLLSKTTNPACLDGRKRSFDNIYGLLKDNFNNSNFKKYDGIVNHLTNTHFYEVSKKEDYQKHLDKLIWLCTSPYKITIKEYFGDAVSKYKTLITPFEFIPLKTIYHRGSFFIAGIIHAENNQVLVLEVNQIGTNFEHSDFIPSKKNLLTELNAELKNRFGLTQNYNDSIYKIELEFSSTTGLYVKEHQWHFSQNFDELKNGNLKMTMSCGINRELVGWVFQWMGNVKIINPPELKDLYAQQLDKILKLQQGETLEYSNIFQPE